MTQLINHNLTSFTADLYIIPHSTNGSLSDGFWKFLNELDVLDEVPVKSKLGDVKIILATLKNRSVHIALACSVEDLTSSYTAIFKICAEVALMLPSGVTRLAAPLLGAGGGGLTSEKSYAVMSKTFEEKLPSEVNITICSISDHITNQIQKDFKPFLQNAERLVLEYTVEQLLERHWVKQMMGMSEFYFAYAKEKFQEFLSFTPNEFTFKDLLIRFIDAKMVYSQFLTTFDERTEEYKFLKLCGELIAYIDRHAYNKNIWNHYSDKRTLARSAVNQTHWIENLLIFRSDGNHYKSRSPSIRNALEYLRQPGEQLTMLSQNHRQMVATAFFNNIGEAEFLATISAFFRKYSLTCHNQDNDGALYSRIFYAPDIKYLWIKKIKSAKKKDNALPTNNVDGVEDEDVLTAEIEEIRTRNLQSLLYSDIYAQVDLLNYQLYASVVAGMITNGLNKPPFNICILAPWGKGKTSMMRFIEGKIKTQRNQESQLILRPTSSFATVYGWLKNVTNAVDFKKLEYPVIWFNAWKFQKSEHIWAGLADGITNQIAEQLSMANRERFWLNLNLKRIDHLKLKRQLVLGFLQKCLFPLLCIIIGFSLSYIFTKFDFNKWSSSFLRQYPQVAEYLPFLIGLCVAAIQGKNAWNKPPELELGKFLLQPEYREKMGYLQAVEDDLRQAIKLAIHADKPAVIFIDDLDRCSPKIISELVEAINSFMTGDMSKCYFIIGQDPQMIIASLDTAYKDIAENAGNFEKHQSIGRFFMEKFSQLSFNLPVMTHTQTDRFVKSLLTAIDQEQIPDETEQKALLETYLDMEKELDSLEEPEQIFTPKKTDIEAKIFTFAPQRVADFQEKILRKAFGAFDINDNELENIILDISTYLENSPRTIKRFLNLYLFYRFLKFTEAGRLLTHIQPPQFCRLLVMMVRWPLMVEAIQWGNQKCFVYGTTPAERAQKLDTLIEAADDHQAFLANLEGELNSSEAGWLKDPQIFDICKPEKVVKVKLSDAVIYGLW